MQIITTYTCTCCNHIYCNDTFVHIKPIFLLPNRQLQECLYEHGGAKIGEVWFDGDVPLFHMKFHTRMALRRLLARQSEVEQTLMTKLWSKSQPCCGHPNK